MDRRYDTYGFGTAPLEVVALFVQQALGLQLAERDSGYYAGTYYLHKQSHGRELRLYRNHDPERGSWVRDQYRDHAVILDVSDLDDMDAIRHKLLNGEQRVVLLSSRVLPAESADTDVGPRSDSDP